MPKLESATLQAPNSAPLGPGVLIANLSEFTPLGVAAAIAGDTSMGFRLGAMTSSPSVSIARETNDLTENYVGINAMFKGATQIMRTDITLEVELAELTHSNIKLLHPGLSESNWLNAAVSRRTYGTGNSAFSVAALTPGNTGDSITVATVAAGANTPLTVVVTGTAPTYTITVNLSTTAVAGTSNATALAVVNAINNHATASTLVQAGLPVTSDGSGTVAGAISQALAGGTTGSKVGV